MWRPSTPCSPRAARNRELSAEPETATARVKVTGGSAPRTPSSASGAICAVVHEDEVLDRRGGGERLVPGRPRR